MVPDGLQWQNQSVCVCMTMSTPYKKKKIAFNNTTNHSEVMTDCILFGETVRSFTNMFYSGNFICLGIQHTSGSK